ncbi:hypothetical protein [Staphylococcus equorum]|nr:hypothetical protein [Staphylococcus equorum]
MRDFWYADFSKIGFGYFITGKFNVLMGFGLKLSLNSKKNWEEDDLSLHD